MKIQDRGFFNKQTFICILIIHQGFAFDELGDVLDSMIETGGMTKEEYQAKVKDFVCSL